MIFNSADALWETIPTSLKPRFPRLVGAGAEMAWYTVAMRNLSDLHGNWGSSVGLESGLAALVHMWVYVAPGGLGIRGWIWNLVVVVVAATALWHL